MQNKTLSAIIITVLTISAVFIAANVRVAENALDLLPGEAVRGDFEILRELGMVDRVFVSLSAAGDIPAGKAVESLKKSAVSIGEELSRSGWISEVFYRLPPGYERETARLFRPSLAALFSPEELQSLEPTLTREGLDEVMRGNFMLLNSPAGLAMKEQIRRDPLGLFPQFLHQLEQLKGELAVVVKDGFFMNKEGDSCLLWFESTLPLTDSALAARVEKDVLAAIAHGLQPDIGYRIIGALPHTLANARTIKHDLQRLLPAAVLALCLFLLVTLRDIRAFAVIGIPFLAAPVGIAMLVLFYDSVSAMALGFGIVLIGIAVDFAIHIYLAVRTHGREGLDQLRKPILLSATTTIGVFVILLFSEVVSHRQMALLAITCLAWAVLLAWLLVPELAGNRKKGAEFSLVGQWLFSLPDRISPYRSVIITGWLLLLLAGVLAFPSLQYNGDLETLDVANERIAADEDAFKKNWGIEQEQVFLVARGDTLDTALNRNDLVHDLLRRNGVREMQSLAGILPGPVRQQRNMQFWEQFWAAHLPALRHNLRQAAEKNGFAAGAFRPFFEWIDSPPQPLKPASIKQSPVRMLFSSLLRLPEDNKTDNAYLAATIVPDREENRPVFEEISSLEGVRYLSNTRWRQVVEKLLKDDIIGFSMAAGVLVIMLALIFFRRPRAVVAVLAPVLSALAAMSVYDFLTTRDLNLMHVLMGIMVIGLSVDYGIFVASTSRKEVSQTSLLAVSICAVSTLTGFGVLTLAAHPALQALGATVLAGIGAAWPTALFVTPIILGKNQS